MQKLLGKMHFLFSSKIVVVKRATHSLYVQNLKNYGRQQKKVERITITFYTHIQINIHTYIYTYKTRKK